MTNITDKELLAICNLSNLKMEFANLKFIEPDTKILSNHTIYSLLKTELVGQEKRENLRKEIIELFTGGVLPRYNPYYRKYNKFLIDIEKGLGKDFGVFFNEDDDPSIRIDWIYHNKNDLIKFAPTLIEYFDSYEESKKDKTNEGAFLEEWEIVFGGDNYSIAKKTAEIYRYTVKLNKKTKENKDSMKKSV